MLISLFLVFFVVQNFEKTMGKKTVISIFLMLFTIVGQAKDYMFKHIEAPEGLSNSQINTIFKDSRGFMWFGTSSGLNRYDGCRIKVYRSVQQEATTLPDSYVRYICEDSNGKLWIETSVGYTLYDPETDCFERDIRSVVFKYGLADKPDKVFVDSQGDLWFYVAGKGFYWYSMAHKILYPFEFGEKTGMLPPGDITCITESKEGTLLVYNTGLLVCLSGDARRIVWMNDYIPVTIGGKRSYTYSAFVDKNENVWVYNSISGVRIYNKAQNKWVTSLEMLIGQWGIPSFPEVNNGVVGIGQDGQGVIWIATRHHGLMIVDPVKKTLVWEKADKNDKRALKHNSMKTLYVSPEKDVVWIGAAKSGLAYYAESMFKFHTDVTVDVTAVSPNGAEEYWLGTSMHGIMGYNPRTGESYPYSKGGDTDLSGHEISALLTARDGSLWAATNKGVLFHLQGNQCQRYQVTSEDGTSSRTTYVIADLLEDVHGHIWIATLGVGVQRLDVKSGTFVRYTKADNYMPSDKVNSLSITRDGNSLLMGTVDGVALLDFDKNTITSYSGTQSGNNLYTSSYVNDVVEDKRGLWWIATRDGINIYDTQRDRLDVIGATEGLHNAVVLGVVCSGEESVWATTAGGICNVVVDKDETGMNYLYRVYTYGEQDGLQGYEFNQRSIMVRPNGEVAMGGTHGVNVFRPDEIKYNKKRPKVLFSGLYMNGREMEVGEEVDGVVVMPKALGHGRQIELKKDHPALTVMFGTDDYGMPERTRFSYKLEGLRDEWIDCHPLRSGITFTKLPPGKYQLKVKAIGGDGYGNNEVVGLSIVVREPFWISFWAKLLYVLLAIVLVALAIKVWLQHERRRIRKELEMEKESLQSGCPIVEQENATNELPVSVSTGELQTTDMEVLPRVVVVDENPEYRQYICDCLSGVYETEAIDDADMAWEIIGETRPDLVVLSVSSIDSEVYFLSHRMKADSEKTTIPLVLLISSQMKDELEAVGADDVCLVKPITRELLQKRLRMLLAGEVSDEMEKEEAVSVPLTADQQLLANATSYVEENISRPDLSVEEMARHIGMSRAHLYKRLMAVSGRTPVEFIRDIRLKRAAELLKDSRFNVSEVAYQVGFNHPKYFSKYFSEVYGVLPSVYQGKGRKG